MLPQIQMLLFAPFVIFCGYPSWFRPKATPCNLRNLRLNENKTGPRSGSSVRIQPKVVINKRFPVLGGLDVLHQGIELLMVAFEFDIQVVLIGQGIG